MPHRCIHRNWANFCPICTRERNMVDFAALKEKNRKAAEAARNNPKPTPAPKEVAEGRDKEEDAAMVSDLRRIYAELNNFEQTFIGSSGSTKWEWYFNHDEAKMSVKQAKVLDDTWNKYFE